MKIAENLQIHHQCCLLTDKVGHYQTCMQMRIVYLQYQKPTKRAVGVTNLVSALSSLKHDSPALCDAIFVPVWAHLASQTAPKTIIRTEENALKTKT